MRCVGIRRLLLVVAMVGCGGSLTGRANDAAGAAGATGSGGAGGGIGVDAGAGPRSERYVWGDVTIDVGPTSSATAGKLVMQVFDPLHPGQPETQMTYPPATRFGPSDGASVTAQYTCGGHGLYEVRVDSCADLPDVAVAPGCMTATFGPESVIGELVDAGGAPCWIQSGIAELRLPRPWDIVVDPETPLPMGGGKFLLDCALDDGTFRQLEVLFVLPVDSWTLLCQP